MGLNNQLPSQIISKDGGIGTAALGGGGAGTILVAFAQVLPETNHWRTFLIIIAPAFSVAVSSLYLWFRSELDNKREKKEIIETVSALRKRLTEKIEDPKIPLNLKDIYIEQLEELERKSFENEIKVLKN